jgi:hypothetical protein
MHSLEKLWNTEIIFRRIIVQFGIFLITKITNSSNVNLNNKNEVNFEKQIAL